MSMLTRGSRVAIVSPASAARPELVERGVVRLRAFGYEPVVMPHALARGPLYYAGTSAERVADLHAAFADENIDGVICTRGGWGSAELLPLLDRELVLANPKAFVGYSDHTSLHVWFWNECGMQTFHAPMVADWSNADGVDERTWRAVIEGVGAWSVGRADGLRILREGSVEGRLLGGCLSILAEGLGTPWGLRIEEPCVLFLEDVGVKPYQWDRMLQHLKFAGVMERVAGVILGEMGSDMEQSCLHALRDFKGPLAIGLRSGHVTSRHRSLPLGAWVRMDGDSLSV